MKRKRFIKKLMAHGVPRNSAVAVAELMRAALVPYKNVVIIGIRPGYEEFSVFVAVDLHLRMIDLKCRTETLGAGVRRELNKIARRNRERRAKEMAKDPWLHSYHLRDPRYDIGTVQGSSSYHPETDLPMRNYHLPSPEELKYLNFKRSIAGLPALPISKEVQNEQRP